MKLRPLLLAAAAAIAAWLAIFGDKTPAAGIAEPVARASSALTAVASRAASSGNPVAAPASSHSHSSAPAGEREPAILALQPRGDLIGGAHGASPSSALFTSQSWTPPPPPPKPVPAPPPTAPALPFTYLGKKAEDGQWEVYLARGAQTYIAREQTVIEDSYRVESITPPTLSLTYLPLNQVQSLTIGGTD